MVLSKESKKEDDMKKNIIKKLGCIFGGLTFFLSIVTVSRAGPAHAKHVFAKPGYTIAPTIDPEGGYQISLYKNGDRVTSLPIEPVVRDDSLVVPILTAPGTHEIGFATTVHSSEVFNEFPNTLSELPSTEIGEGDHVVFWPVRPAPGELSWLLVPGNLNVVPFRCLDSLKVRTEWGIFEINVVGEAPDTGEYTVGINGPGGSVDYRFERDGVIEFKDMTYYLKLNGVGDHYGYIDIGPVLPDNEPVMVNLIPIGENYKVNIAPQCYPESVSCYESNPLWPIDPNNAVRVLVHNIEPDESTYVLIWFEMRNEQDHLIELEGGDIVGAFLRIRQGLGIILMVVDEEAVVQKVALEIDMEGRKVMSIIKEDTVIAQIVLQMDDDYYLIGPIDDYVGGVPPAGGMAPVLIDHSIVEMPKLILGWVDGELNKKK